MPLFSSGGDSELRAAKEENVALLQENFQLRSICDSRIESKALLLCVVLACAAPGAISCALPSRAHPHLLETAD